jgi:PAS domain S-box-containing protein
MGNSFAKWIAVASLAVLGLGIYYFSNRPGRKRQTVRVGIYRLTPFEPTRVDGRPSGLLVDLLEAAARRKKIILDWVDAPEGGERSLDSRLIDIWPGMDQTPARHARFHITKPFLRKDFCLISPYAKPIRTAREAAGHRISLVNGPITRSLAAAYLPNAERYIVRDRTHTITSVCRGEVDGGFSETSYFQMLILLSRPEECSSFHFFVSPVSGPAIQMGLASLPENAGIAETLRAGIEELRSDGEFSRILATSMPMAIGENEVLFEEQRRRIRTVQFSFGIGAAALLLIVAFWYNRRVSRARRLTEQANAALKGSMAQLRDAHRRLRFQVDCMPLACIVWDANLRVREWNPAAVRIFGWTAEEAHGRSLEELLLPADDSATGGAWREVALSGESRAIEQENVARDGRHLVCEWVVSPLRDDNGRIIGLLSLALDITDRTRLEEELRQSQKLESIGRLAGGVAHDFNNLLTVINGNSDLLLADLGPLDPVRKPLAEIRTAGERAADLTHQLLAFSRKQILSPRPLDLNQELSRHEGMLRRLLGEDIVLQVELGPDLGLVMADPGQIHRVILNLLANARDAMPDGGTVTISTANVELNSDECESRPGLEPGPYVELSVSDTGVGMDRETGQRIFEPFFTTKERATATGLGLPMVHGVVSQSGGWIEAISELGKGARFQIHLPRLAAAPRPVEERPPQRSASPPNGAGAVLIVEDQPSVRRLAAAVLKRSGYSVLDAGSGQEAIALAERHSHPIDLVLTDLVMPGMKGPEVASALLRLHPESRILYMTGYSADASSVRTANGAAGAVLTKPFSPDDLVAGVRAAIEGAPSAG